MQTKMESWRLFSDLIITLHNIVLQFHFFLYFLLLYNSPETLIIIVELSMPLQDLKITLRQTLNQFPPPTL